MDKIARRILSDNVRRMMDKARARSVRQWAMSNGLDVRQMDRIVKGEHAVTLDTLDVIAEKIGCQPWQLLVPNMDPHDLPMLVMRSDERELYERVRALIQQASKPT